MKLPRQVTTADNPDVLGPRRESHLAVNGTDIVFPVEDHGNVQVAVRGTLRTKKKDLHFLPEIVETCEIPRMARDRHAETQAEVSK